MKVGDRVRLSAEGRAMTYIFYDTEVLGVIVLPGTSRGRLYLRVLMDGAKGLRTFAARYWEKVL